MTIRLRPHHLLCILTYAGEGYSRRFIENFSALLKRIERGETVTIVSGPDALCSPIRHEPDSHCNKISVRERDSRAAQDLSQLLCLTLAPGATLQLSSNKIQRLRERFAQGHIRSACKGCEWHELCSTIADKGFISAHLQYKPS